MPDPERTRRQNNARKVLAYLQAHGEATNAELLRIGGFRYGGRVHELRKAGYVIDTIQVAKGLFKFVYRGSSRQMPLKLSA